MSTDLQALFSEELDTLRDRNLYRSIKTLEDIRGANALLNGNPVLLFCGNDYLGLSQHASVIKAAKKAADLYGIGSGAARLISGGTHFHERLEQKLAALKSKESALLFTTGYLANLGILSSLAGEKDLVVMDKLCHASLIDGARLSGAKLRVFPHKNYEKCEELVSRAEGFEKIIIVTDSVFSMDGDLADLARLVEIKRKYSCMLVVDDAHGTGVLGTNGKGAAEDQKLYPDIDIVMGTLSKALGSLGGFVCADRTLIDFLVNRARPFIFATSLPPLICASAMKAVDLLTREPELRHRLWQNIQHAHEGLQAAGFSLPSISSPILPIITGDEQEALRLSEGLLKKGLMVPAIRYPTVAKHKARLRVTISALHTFENIDLLVRSLKGLVSTKHVQV